MLSNCTDLRRVGSVVLDISRVLCVWQGIDDSMTIVFRVDSGTGVYQLELNATEKVEFQQAFEKFWKEKNNGSE